MHGTASLAKQQTPRYLSAEWEIKWQAQLQELANTASWQPQLSEKICAH